MESLLLSVNIIIAVLLVVIILLQKSEGGALGLGVSQDNFASSRAVFHTASSPQRKPPCVTPNI